MNAQHDRYRWIRVGGILAIVLSTFYSQSAVAANDPYQFRSRYYEIRTDVDQPLAHAVAEHMDVMFAAYMDRFRGFPVRNPARQPLYVFQKKEDYLRLLSRHGIDGAGTGGMFFVTESGDGLATFLGDQTVERMFHTLRHEGFHQFAFARIGSGLPLWANEGLAEYFADSMVTAKSVTHGMVSRKRLIALRAAIDDGSVIPIERLRQRGRDEWNAELRNGRAGLQYTQSWALVHSLMQGPPGHSRAFEHYLQRLARGVTEPQAFAEAFSGAEFQDFENQWKQYVLQLQPTPEAEAAQRLEFLAYGLKWLHDRGIRPDSIEDLRRRMQRANFSVSFQMGYAQDIVMTSRDAENFQPPEVTARGAKKPTIDLSATKDKALPPEIVVRGLSSLVRLVWQQDSAGTLHSRVLYE